MRDMQHEDRIERIDSQQSELSEVVRNEFAALHGDLNDTGDLLDRLIKFVNRMAEIVGLEPFDVESDDEDEEESNAEQDELPFDSVEEEEDYGDEEDFEDQDDGSGDDDLELDDEGEESDTAENE